MADEVSFNVDPSRTPIYFVDSYVITSDNHAVTVNMAQAVIGGEQRNIVARFAMTAEQAKEFLGSLNDHLEKFER
ncbi:hypothetical protein H7171_00425 [Candidatus Saccharibacteria bacterium]|nr:hypothetical protein [Candidatus Saccharibacteria bacterium]